MRRKAVSVLLGGVMAISVCGGDVRAMTYSYDIGDGVIYTITKEGEIGQIQEEAAEYHIDTEASEAEQKKWADWHKEEMRQQVAYLETYGVTYDADKDALYYKGQTVRWLIDGQIDDTYKAIRMPEGEIDLYTVRAGDYRLTGVRTATPEEYEERTRQDEAAKQEAAITDVIVEEKAAEAYEAEYGVEKVEQIEAEATYAVEGDYKETEKKIREYKEHGIDNDSESGCWMWQGKMIYYLMDEDGGVYQNGSEKAKEDKVYIVVKRNADGSIKEVKQVTVEEVMAERILRDGENHN